MPSQNKTYICKYIFSLLISFIMLSSTSLAFANEKSDSKKVLKITAPLQSKINKPFIAVLYLSKKDHNFSLNNIEVNNGSISSPIFSKGGKRLNILVTPDSSMDLSKDSYVKISVPKISKDVYKEVQIVNASADDEREIIIKEVEVIKEVPVAARIKKDPVFGYMQIVYGQGGDNVSTTKKAPISNTLGVQFGVSYPLHKIITSDSFGFVSSGSIRFNLGYEQMMPTANSKSVDYTTFNAINSDLLYVMPVYGSVYFLAGGTAVFNGKLDSRALYLKDLSQNEHVNAKVEFEPAYGGKLLLEYVNDNNTLDWYIGGGLSLITYTLKTVQLVGEAAQRTSPTRIDASSIKLYFGIRI